MSLTKITTVFATTFALATPALADPTLGLGLSFSFGGGKPQTGIGLRVFSDDERDSFVGSVGVDYMFGTQSFRGTVGGAYLGNDTYLGLDMGFDFNGGGFGFGFGAGGVGTKAGAAGSGCTLSGGAGCLD
ncbi:hypothetical protein C8J27_11331 [Rhodobacter aestuarii]|uniref:Outer membrane protein beta-barrel domain-containing protein n=1 Tax=Rhodobacter aestuarii TaxID=453582 RepID=A0A1N7QBS6_9RHOB|nr:hypothetical protein [Rhodobacter aestuarii]PTV93666.1 hypothetical protein C8J27_11331 [Rhodobacter aestuarii]SIT20189.1 hypothetical protein SAMN05421580_11530 [Rhodobacter aestuarii]